MFQWGGKLGILKFFSWIELQQEWVESEKKLPKTFKIGRKFWDKPYITFCYFTPKGTYIRSKFLQLTSFKANEDQTSEWQSCVFLIKLNYLSWTVPFIWLHSSLSHNSTFPKYDLARSVFWSCHVISPCHMRHSA